MKKYSIGLDIGTGSVGWSTLNDDYKPLKINGKEAWGAFLFEDAKTAVATRIKRGQRRRYDRRRERIFLLQELMGEDVLSVDDNFFVKLKESSLRSDVCDTPYKRENHYNLFEGDYTDKAFYKEFKTIYHLRKRLMVSTEKEDIRFTYLALHHILKFRGNFLYEGKNISASGGLLQDEMQNLFEVMSSDLEIDNNLTLCIDSIVETLKDAKLSKATKIDNLIKLTTKEGKKKPSKEDTKEKTFYTAIFKAILGYSVDFCKLINAEEVIKGDNGKPLKISFSDANYDEQENMFLGLAEGKTDFISQLKAVYSAILFENITNGKECISDAMIAKYEKHKTDLSILKRLLKASFPKRDNPATGNPFYTEYLKMFRRNSGVYNYAFYIAPKEKAIKAEKTANEGKEKVSGKKVIDKRSNREKFYDYVKEVLEKIDDGPDKKECLEQIELDNFLPLMNTVENSALPFQLNKHELIKIIDNQSLFYPRLKENKEKILSILEFRRPYYVGTLKGKFSWCKQKIEERVTPWNFFDLVKTDEAEESFIKKMSSDCMYFNEEKTLPKESITYQAYSTLNELNKIRVDNKEISVEWKKEIFNKLFCKVKSVSKKSLAKFLGDKFNIKVKDEDISGLADDKFNSNMSTLIDFSKLKHKFSVENIKKYDEAVRIITLFSDVKVRKKRLNDLDLFDKDGADINFLLKLKKKGWGKFSNKALNEVLGRENKTIIETLYDTNKHFNEILFDKTLGFMELLIQEEEKIKTFNYKRDVEGLYCSPSVKKAIWNSLKVVEDIVKVTKAEPESIFIEDTHETKEKKKTASRVDILKDLYDKIKEEAYFNPDSYDYLKDAKANGKKIDGDKLYLWLLQLGRCMYSGDIIPFDQLSKCEIDHIVPRSYIKDDSFENRVLVKGLENQFKTDTLSISPIIKARMQGFWKFLLEKNFIKAKKYLNLTRGEYTDNDKIGFINRQLVETNQVIKEVEKILKKRFPDATIVGIRAGLVTTFRKKYSQRNKAGFYKLRNLNNFHHAKDAYLTAVLGKFTTQACPLWGQDDYNRMLKYYIANNDKSKYDVKTLSNFRHGIIIDLMEYGDADKFEISEDGEYLWDSQRYSNVFATMERNTCNIVKKKLYQANSDFYNQNLYGPNVGKENLFPIKSKDGIDKPTNIYGGYAEEHSSYYAIVEYTKSRKKEIEKHYAVVNIPLLLETKAKAAPTIIDEYIKDKYGETAKIAKKIYKNQLVNYKGHLCYITGASELNNAVELFVDAKFEKLLYSIEKEKFNFLNEKEEETSLLIKEFFSHYIEKINKHMPLFANLAKKLEDILKSDFDSVPLADKIKLVKDILVVSKSGAGRVTLDKIFGNGGYGRLIATIYPEEIEWINYSCTGLHSEIKKGV